MIAEFGYFSLILTACCALLQTAATFGSELFARAHWLSANRLFTYLQALFAISAFGCLAYAFAVDDFSVSYISAHSNSQLPLFFKIAAVWGGHEGSMLFWLTMLALWSAVFARFSHQIEPQFAHRTLGVLALVIAGFALFILLVSDPFVRAFPPPPEGRDLNPMLQDIGLIIHPPLLYLGYVGFTVCFALIVSALQSGVLDAAVANWIRPWALSAWGFLTGGIMLGAWWAYYELGWGGWWFWDPVENASLMPWLLGTAFLHSLIASQQRGILSYWTILLAIFAFALSLLGTFIVRSGVLTSVHAFAVDPDRGMALLVLFFALSFIALALFAFKVNLWQGDVRFALFSKETAFLLLNGLFSVAAGAVLLGTFYPMIFTALDWGAISIGAPYFNRVFAPLALLLMTVMGIATVLYWKRIAPRLLWQKIALFAPAVALAWGLIQHTISRQNLFELTWLPLTFVSLAVWIIFTHIPLKRAQWQLRPLAMRLAHIGFAVCVIGAMMNSYYGDEIGVRLKPGDSHTLAGFHFRYDDYRDAIGANYTAEQAHFTLTDSENNVLAAITPERRYYDVRTMTMAEVGLYHHGLDDIYIVMGDKFGNAEYAFRLHYKPYVRALWLGAWLMVAAALLGLYARTRKQPG